MMRYYFTLVAAIMLMAGCGKEEPPMGTPDDSTQTPDDPTTEEVLIELTDRRQVSNIESNTTKATIEFEVDVDWELVIRSYTDGNTDWVWASTTSGAAGKHSVEIFMDKNISEDARWVDVEIRDVTKQATRASVYPDLGMSEMLNIYTGACYVVSLIQLGYYDSNYGFGLRVNLTPHRLEDLVNEYIEEKGITYQDIVYLDIHGTPDSYFDYKFINDKLTKLRFLNLREADITEIPVGAFSYNNSIHYITLPRYLQKIHNNAFYNSELRNVNLFIPETVKYIGMNAFAGSQISGQIAISNITGTIEISRGAFDTGLVMMLQFCEGMRYIEGGSPCGNHLPVLVIPSSATYVGQAMFEGVTFACCYAENPPDTDGILLQEDDIGIMAVPLIGMYTYSVETSPFLTYANAGKIAPIL